MPLQCPHKTWKHSVCVCVCVRVWEIKCNFCCWCWVPIAFPHHYCLFVLLKLFMELLARIWKSHTLVCVCFGSVLVIPSLFGLFGFFFFLHGCCLIENTAYRLQFVSCLSYFTNQPSCLMVQLRLLGNSENRVTAYKVSQHSSSKFQIAEGISQKHQTILTATHLLDNFKWGNMFKISFDIWALFPSLRLVLFGLFLNNNFLPKLWKT